jgi:hypothetical protein
VSTEELLPDLPGFSLESGDSEADLQGIPLPKITYKGVEFEVYSLHYKTGVRRILLERVLCSKLIYFPEKVTRIDILVLYDNLLHCQDIAAKNENFVDKFGSALEVLTKILKGFQYSNRTDLKSIRKLGVILEEKLQGFYLPKRNTLTELSKQEDSYSIKPFVSKGTLNKNIPPKVRIGKGYTDKGTARDPAIDGSPSWQEVANSDIDGEFKDDHEN